MVTAAERRDKMTKASLLKRLRASVERTLTVTVTATKARDEFSTWINTVSYGGKWVILKRHGKPAAAMVSLEDLRLLEKLEDEIDLKAARESLKEKGNSVPWEKVKAELGI